jgi:adenylate cyclase
MMESNFTNFVLREEKNSEITSALVQLVFILLLLVVYFISPKGFEAGTPGAFEPILWISIIYVPVLILRLWKAISLNLNQTVGYVFILVDVAILTALIFSFHIQYGGNFNLSLKAPTFLYYFLFIAMAALSYDGKRVWVAGLSSMFVWSVLVGYGFFYSDLVQTRSYSDSILPNSLLLGVEIDKIIALFVVTSVLYLSVRRKKILLARLTKSAVYSNSIEKLVGKQALENVLGGKTQLAPGTWKKVTGATLMVDLRGFSLLANQIAPEKVLEVLEDYYRIVAETVFKYNGTVDKYMGDGVLAHFGVIYDNPKYASQSLSCATEIQDKLLSWTQELKQKDITLDYGVAIALGEVIFGVVGHKDKMEITVIGDVVNLTAKIEKHTKFIKAKVLTTKKTLDAAVQQGYTPDQNITIQNNQNVSGLALPMDLIVLR